MNKVKLPHSSLEDFINEKYPEIRWVFIEDISQAILTFLKGTVYEKGMQRSYKDLDKIIDYSITKKLDANGAKLLVKPNNFFTGLLMYDIVCLAAVTPKASSFGTKEGKFIWADNQMIWQPNYRAEKIEITINITHNLYETND